MADLVPGVSGGTVALLLGIYEELIFSIKMVSGEVVKLAVRGRVKEAVKKVPWEFLVPLLVGLLTAVVSMARVLTYLLAHYGVYVWGVFFGLIVASAVVVSKRVVSWSTRDVVALFLAVIVGFVVVGAVPVETADNLGAFFLAGAVAIVAMILPGVSGSFILVILGKYEQVLEAVTTSQIDKLAVFLVGAVIGLAVFSRLLSFLFERYHDVVIASLVGFMLGSLRKVWPWREVLQTKLDRHGDLEVVADKMVLPGQVDLTVVIVIGLMILGAILVLNLERLKLTEEVSGDVEDTEFAKRHKNALDPERNL